MDGYQLVYIRIKMSRLYTYEMYLVQLSQDTVEDIIQM